MHRGGAVHPPASRVVYRNLPYLVELKADGSVARAFGPFTPGTEPSLEECSDENQVSDVELIRALTGLLPRSPSLPAADDSLANS
jgi:hypothetical protein